MADSRNSGKTKAACAKIGCPFSGIADGHSRCAECPGPKYFKANHDCHKCFLNGMGDARCSICLGPSEEPSHKGMSVVSMDAMADGDGDRLLGKRIDTQMPTDALGLTPEQEEVARRVSAFYLKLDTEEFELVKHLTGGGNLSTFASIHNTTRQKVWKMAMKMMRRSPEMRAIVKERKQLNGRVMKPRAEDARQMTLF